MTKRRWQQDDEDESLGPLESAVSGELEGLGFTPLTGPGPLRTAAERALLLAETYDRSQNAAALPGLDRAIKDVMIEARQAAQSGALTEDDVEEREEEVDDFTKRRERRQEGPPPPTGTEGK